MQTTLSSPVTAPAAHIPAIQHTEGPWEARPVPGARVIVIAQAGKMHPHAHVTTPTDHYEPLGEQELANAALIEASPDLLAAVEGLLRCQTAAALEHARLLNNGNPICAAIAAVQKARDIERFRS